MRLYGVEYRLKGRFRPKTWTDLGVYYTSAQIAQRKASDLYQLAPNYKYRVISYRKSVFKTWIMKVFGIYQDT